jgi:hypothetical protein
MTDPAQRLLELAEAECLLVREGRFDEIAPLQEERDAVIAALPVPVPVRSEPVLARARAVMHEAAHRAAAARVELAAELVAIDRGRQAARGYAPAGVGSGPTVDLAG